MSEKKEPAKKTINTRLRTRQRFLSFDENRLHLDNIDDNLRRQLNNPDQYRRAQIHDQSFHDPIDQVPLDLDDPRVHSEQVAAVGVPGVSSNNNECQALVPFASPRLSLANYNQENRPQSIPAIQNIYLPNQAFHHIDFSSFETPTIRVPPNFMINQFIITQFGQNFSITNLPFLKKPPVSDFAFLNRDTRSIEYTTNSATMALFSIKDLVGAIPTYNGDEKQLETFINVCTKFHSLLKEDQRDQFVTIVQTKITGEALADLQPIDDLKTWREIKTKLEEKLRSPDTYEFAQEELSTIRQRKNESVEEYGKRIRKGLEKLNLASKSLTQEETALIPLRKANEIHAIRKFEQNMFNEKIKLMVGAADFKSLRDAIKFAMNKELFQKTTNVKTCTFCKNIGHVEEECRKKSLQSNARKEQKHVSEPPRDGSTNNFRRNNHFPSRSYDSRGENGQRYYYGTRVYDSNNGNYSRGQNYSNQQNNFQRNNPNEQNYPNSRPNTNEVNQRENNRGPNHNNEQPKNNGSITQSNSRFDRTTPRNMRTIHELNSQLETMAIAEEQGQSKNAASTSKN